MKISHPTVVIGCAVCLNTIGKRVPATTVVAGYAVCDEHVHVASMRDFDISEFAHQMRPF